MVFVGFNHVMEPIKRDAVRLLIVYTGNINAAFGRKPLSFGRLVKPLSAQNYLKHISGNDTWM